MWNYRTVEMIDRHTGEKYYVIKEAYYNSNNEIHSLTEGVCNPQGDSVENLKGDLKLMLRALKKPVLVERNFIYAKADESEK